MNHSTPPTSNGQARKADLREAPVPKPFRTRLGLARHLLWRATKLEYFGYVSILRYITRRHGVPPGGTGFSYHKTSVAPVTLFLVLSLAELIVVDLLVRRWPTVRLVMLILGVWGLIYMFGLLFGMVTRPHVVTSERLQLKQGPETTLSIKWSWVRTVTKRGHSTNGQKSHRVTQDLQGRTVINLWASGESNIELELDEPKHFDLPGHHVEAARVRFYVDDPTAFMDTVRPILRPPRPPA